MMSGLAGQTVAVTGGSGFIGAHLVEALLQAGSHVVNLDIKPPTLPGHAPLWRAVDLMDGAAVRVRLAEAAPAVVYNLAAHASLSGGAAAMRVNVEGLRHVMDALYDLPARPLLIHASTQLVAGVLGEDFDPLDLTPYGEYGQSKAESERLLRAAPVGLRWVIVRPSNIWGAYHPSFAKSIWRYIRLRLYLHPSGVEVKRSYGYVGNVVHQLVRLAEVDPTKVEGQVFYVGDAPMDSAIWLDGFSRALTGKPVRRMPIGLLRLAAGLGDRLQRLGGPAPLNSGRLERMTTDFPVPMRRTFETIGAGPFSFSEGLRLTTEWLKRSA